MLLAGVSLYELGYAVALRAFDEDTHNFNYLPTASYVSSGLNAVTMVTPITNS